MIRTFTVKPNLPEKLSDLKLIAKNVFWAWDSEVVELFKRIDVELWEKSEHNPVAMLGMVSQSRLMDLAENDGFLYQLAQAKEKMQECLNAYRWFDTTYDRENTENQPMVAYFSAEFGIHESIPIYSGGLGVLAGDHLKSASDLGVPLVGVGLMYQKGYFRQYLNSDGWQQEHLKENDFYSMPIELVRKKTKRPLTIGVQFPSRIVRAQIWKLNVGRVCLYLLDTNIADNSPKDRRLTEQLYGGDNETRICQEIILGIGGLKALIAMGIEPGVCHMNEGHAAFMALERVRRLRNKKNMTFDEAVEAARTGNIFTVHTPVAAGNDEFEIELMDKYFGHYYGKLGINRKQFLALGRVDPEDEKEKFKMPVLAIKMSAHRNGVSELHGDTSRRMWHGLWTELPLDEVPIKSITNGIHIKSWLSSDMNDLFERYLGSNWAEGVVDQSVWDSIDQIPDEELWRIHQRCKERLVNFTRKRLVMQMQRRGAFRRDLSRAQEALDPEALTIGFARRFATYKRGNLILRDAQRLIRLLSDSEKPLQIIFAGKAHPRDNGGKDIIRQIVHFASQEPVRGRIVFLEDYDMNVARYLVEGVDVWLNNPRRPLEASGTSGMKAAVNGILNLSTLDGWWCEGYVPDGGWVIGAGESYEDKQYQDAVESDAMFNLLEEEVIPLYYNLGSDDRTPREWIARMKTTIKWCCPRFNTNRMVAEYTRKFYMPSASRWQQLCTGSMDRIRELSHWKTKVKKAWSELSIEDVEVLIDDGKDVYNLNDKQPQLEVGCSLRVNAKVNLGSLAPDDVAVEIFYGKVDSGENIIDGDVQRMGFDQSASDGVYSIFTGVVPCEKSGHYGFALRIMPSHPDMVDPYEPGLVLWEGRRQPEPEPEYQTV